VAPCPDSSLTRYARWFADRPQTVVLQPTTWCNLDCSYCYLPMRRLKHQMAPQAAEAVAKSLTDLTDEAHPIGVVWHGGEPLSVGPGKFTNLLAPFEELRQQGRVHHYVQTNATLVTDTWCKLLSDHEVRVGVSIDGPAALNADRIDLHGKPAFDRINRGIARLREHAIAFSAIAVVGTDAIHQPERLLDFLAGLGCRSVGINIEEVEGANTDRQPPTPEQAADFWRRTLTWARHHHGSLEVRELERLGDYLRLVRAGQRAEWEARRLDPIPTISCNGDVVLLSPELADTADPAYGNFVAGNILNRPLADILRTAHRLRYVREFTTGLEACQATCDYFDFCRGAQAANRYFENGSLATTETNYCRVSRQALVTALSTIATTEEKAA
jgi:uncharacterized protein